MNSSPNADSRDAAGEPRQWPWKLVVLLALAVAAALLAWVTWLQPSSLVAPDGDLIEQGAAPAATGAGTGAP
jgi:hypothetical protein